MGRTPAICRTSVEADGSADTTFTVPASLPVQGPESMIGPQKRALVIHADPDDQKTDPSGNSGARRRLRGDRARLSGTTPVRMTLLRLTDRGLYCEAGDFYVDPWGAVDRAVVTHAHGDHVAWGCRAYLTIRRRGGRAAKPPRARGASRRAAVRRADLHSRRRASRSIRPATSSAPPRSALEHGGEVWVVSGDYKTDPDPTTTPFEPVRCHTFVTESTFGLPIYRWPPQEEVLRRDQRLVARQPGRRARPACSMATRSGRRSGCSPGSDPASGPILTHGAVERMTAVYRAAGMPLPPTTHAGAVDRRTDWSRAIILAPPSADGSTWTRRFGTHATGVRLGMDAGARRAAPPVTRPRLSAVGSRGLAQPAGRHRGDRRGAGVGDPRLHRPGGSLAAGAGPGCERGADPVRGRRGRRRRGPRG